MVVTGDWGFPGCRYEKNYELSFPVPAQGQKKMIKIYFVASWTQISCFLEYGDILYLM